jgi:hypothetical protein
MKEQDARLARDGDQGHRVEQCVREARHEVRRAGARRRDANADLAGALAPALRREDLALQNARRA